MRKLSSRINAKLVVARHSAIKLDRIHGRPRGTYTRGRATEGTMSRMDGRVSGRWKTSVGRQLHTRIYIRSVSSRLMSLVMRMWYVDSLMPVFRQMYAIIVEKVWRSVSKNSR